MLAGGMEYLCCCHIKLRTRIITFLATIAVVLVVFTLQRDIQARHSISKDLGCSERKLDERVQHSEHINAENKSIAKKTFQSEQSYYEAKTIKFEPIDRKNDDILYPIYETMLSSDEKRFINVDLYENPDEADWLSKRLRSTVDIIREAQRVHYHLFSRLLRGYKRAVLANVYNWTNRGDHVITMSEQVIFARWKLNLDYYCFFPNNCDFERVQRGDDLVIFFQGGGYLGNKRIPLINKTIASFPDNRIIFFPNSFSHKEKENIELYRQILSTHNDLHILLRDRISYEIAKKNFPTAHCLLSPDLAFALGPQVITMVPTHDIIWVKRHDWENYHDNDHDKLPDIPKNLTHLVHDWEERFMRRKTTNFLEDNQLKSMSAFIHLARGKVVISDRLHAHIMCTLLDKPNVLVNSITRKQQNYFDTWEASVNSSRCVDSARTALQLAIKLMNDFPYLKHN